MGGLLAPERHEDTRIAATTESHLAHMLPAPFQEDSPVSPVNGKTTAARKRLTDLRRNR
jgi:hypothetical protein